MGVGGIGAYGKIPKYTPGFIGGRGWKVERSVGRAVRASAASAESEIEVDRD